MSAIPLDSLSLWTIYDHPRDYPQHIVMRRSLYVPGSGEQLIAWCAGLYDTLDEARRDAYAQGASGFFDRSPGDDPVILEVWM